jgi:hypothetical protein
MPFFWAADGPAFNKHDVLQTFDVPATGFSQTIHFMATLGEDPKTLPQQADQPLHKATDVDEPKPLAWGEQDRRAVKQDLPPVSRRKYCQIEPHERCELTESNHLRCQFAHVGDAGERQEKVYIADNSRSRSFLSRHWSLCDQAV